MAYTFPAGNAVWKPEDLIALVCQPGFMSPDDWRPITACCVALAESGGNPLQPGKVIWNPGNVTHLSIDLGMWQLNSYYQTAVNPYPDLPKITVADCFDPFKAWAHTWKLINRQRTGWNFNWSQWTTYRTGAFNKHTAAALAGMRLYRTAMALGPGVFA